LKVIVKFADIKDSDIGRLRYNGVTNSIITEKNKDPRLPSNNFYQETSRNSYKAFYNLFYGYFYYDTNLSKYLDRWGKKSYRKNVYKYIDHVLTYTDENVPIFEKMKFLRKFLPLEVNLVTTNEKIDARKKFSDYKEVTNFDPKMQRDYTSLYNTLRFVKEGIQYLDKRNHLDIFSYTVLLLSLKDYLYHTYSNRFRKYVSTRFEESLKNKSVQDDNSNYIIYYGNEILRDFPLIEDKTVSMSLKSGRSTNKIMCYYGKKFNYEPEDDELNAIKETIEENLRFIHSYFNRFKLLSKKECKNHEKNPSDIYMDLLVFLVFTEDFYTYTYDVNSNFKQNAVQFYSFYVKNDGLNKLSDNSYSLYSRKANIKHFDYFQFFMIRKSLISNIINHSGYYVGNKLYFFINEEISERFIFNNYIDINKNGYLSNRDLNRTLKPTDRFVGESSMYRYLVTYREIIKYAFKDSYLDNILSKKFNDQMMSIIDRITYYKLIKPYETEMIELNKRYEELSEIETLSSDGGYDEYRNVRDNFNSIRRKVNDYEKDIHLTYQGNKCFPFAIFLTSQDTITINNILERMINMAKINGILKIGEDINYKIIWQYISCEILLKISSDFEKSSLKYCDKIKEEFLFETVFDDGS